jgi:hypothetical protein
MLGNVHTSICSVVTLSLTPLSTSFTSYRLPCLSLIGHLTSTKHSFSSLELWKDMTQGCICTPTEIYVYLSYLVFSYIYHTRNVAEYLSYLVFSHNLPFVFSAICSSMYFLIQIIMLLFFCWYLILCFFCSRYSSQCLCWFLIYWGSMVFCVLIVRYAFKLHYLLHHTKFVHLLVRIVQMSMVSHSQFFSFTPDCPLHASVGCP